MSGHLVFPVLGVPTRFESDSAEVLEIAEEAFGAWRVLEGDSRWIDGDEARVRIRVVRGEEGPEDHATLRFAMPRRACVRFSTRASHGWSDGDLREAYAEVTEALVRDRQHFRYGVLEALALALVTRLDREPLHAAALVRGSTALLLAGRSGVGKSTLAYAAVREGMRVLSEDVVYLQLDPFRVWGMPGYLHVPVDSAAFFPELDGTAPAVRANGKIKIAVGLRERGALAPRPVVDRAGICVVERGAGPRLAALSPDEVVRALSAAPEEGFAAFADTIGARIARLAEHGGWRMSLPPHPADALPLLHEMFDALDVSGAAPEPPPGDEAMSSPPAGVPAVEITVGHPALEHARTSTEGRVIWPLTVRGPVDADLLRRALAAVLARREGNGGGEGIELETVDLRQTTAQEGDTELRKLAARELERPLSPGARLRALLLRMDPADRRVLILTVHHIVSDGWSVWTLRDVLERAYKELQGAGG